MFNKEVKSILDLIKAFPNEQSCIDHLEKLRWDEKVISPFDADSKVYNCKGNRYKCKNTGKYFNVKTNTLFDNTKIPLQKWFVAIWIVTSHKKGISSIQLGKDLGITQKTAWFLLQRIRNCFNLNDEDKLDNEVEIDETFVGGKSQNVDKGKKATVMGMVERQGKIKAKHIKDASGNSILPEVYKNINRTAKIYTDQSKVYTDLKYIYNHQTVKHNEKEYVRGRVSTNTIEGFWALLKRMIFGTYHWVSKKHLQKYVDEMVFRYNTRKGGENERFNLFLGNLENRLTYEKLTNG